MRCVSLVAKWIYCEIKFDCITHLLRSKIRNHKSHHQRCGATDAWDIFYMHHSPVNARWQRLMQKVSLKKLVLEYLNCGSAIYRHCERKFFLKWQQRVHYAFISPKRKHWLRKNLNFSFRSNRYTYLHIFNTERINFPWKSKFIIFTLP